MEGCWSLSNISRPSYIASSMSSQLLDVHYYNPTTDTVTAQRNFSSAHKPPVGVALPFYETKRKLDRRPIPYIFVPTDFARSLLHLQEDLSKPEYLPSRLHPDAYPEYKSEDTSRGPLTGAWPHEKCFKKPDLNPAKQSVSAPQLYTTDIEAKERHLLPSCTVDQRTVKYEDVEQPTRNPDDIIYLMSSGTSLSSSDFIKDLIPQSVLEQNLSKTKSLQIDTDLNTKSVKKRSISDTRLLLPMLQAKTPPEKVKNMYSLLDFTDKCREDTVNSMISHYENIYPICAPANLYSETEIHFKILSLKIWQRYLHHQLPIKIYATKINIWNQLQILLHKKRPDLQYKLFLTGSTLSGLSGSDSDMDLCIKAEKEPIHIERYSVLFHLEYVKYLLHSVEEVDNLLLIDARVPLLKFKVLLDFPIEVNLTCNNFAAVANTQFLYSFAKCDWRFQPLCSIIKQWAMCNEINEPLKKTLSSYSLSLLVVQFLQDGISPPVLPCLHNFEGNFSVDYVVDKGYEEIFSYYLNDWKSGNEMSLGELLVNFFKFYNSLDFSKQVISVRIGKPVERNAYKNLRKHFEFSDKEFIYVEEPFTLSNTAYAVHCPVAFRAIKVAISTALERLGKTAKLEELFESENESEIESGNDSDKCE